MKTPILQVENLPSICLMISGEDFTLVKSILKEIGIEISKEHRAREFSVFHSLIESKEFSIVITGLGSASIELATQELLQSGVDTIILAGTCGASKDYKIGEPVFIESGAFERGSPNYYKEFKGKKSCVHPDFINSLPELKRGSIISSDSFYAIGGILKEGKIIYLGAKTRIEPIWVNKFRKLYNSKSSYLIDMETAFFYAFGEIFENFKFCAIKGVSNYVPFNPINIIKEERLALKNSISSSILLISEL